VRRAEITQPGVGLPAKLLLQRRGDAGFSDTRLTGNEHDLTVAVFGPSPSAEQQLHLLLSADERGQRGGMKRLEPAFDDTWPKHLPHGHHAGEALHLLPAEVAIFEQMTDESARALVARLRTARQR
jgi:hypothetical protein